MRTATKAFPAAAGQLRSRLEGARVAEENLQEARCENLSTARMDGPPRDLGKDAVHPLGTGARRYDSILPLCDARGGAGNKGDFVRAGRARAAAEGSEPDARNHRLPVVPAKFDYHIALMSMPLAFKTDAGIFPRLFPICVRNPSEA